MIDVSPGRIDSATTLKSKQEILKAIRQVAADSGGKPPGIQRFASLTGIQPTSWRGVYWSRWSEAVSEAGFEAGGMSSKRSDEDLLMALARMVGELGRIPTEPEMRLKSRADPSFPSTSTFGRLGNKRERAVLLLEFCKERGLEDVAEHCRASMPPEVRRDQNGTASTGGRAAGYVYLVQHGGRAEYKLGRTANALRRLGEIRLELPRETRPLHYIETDDPAGIEAYWHRRFAEKRLRGEWFALTPHDVQAFRRWKKIF